MTGFLASQPKRVSPRNDGTYGICLSLILNVHVQPSNYMVSAFNFIHTLLVRASNTLSRRCGCKGLSEHWLLADVITHAKVQIFKNPELFKIKS